MRLNVEELERRDVPAVIVNGTAGNDTITVTDIGNGQAQVVVNGVIDIVALAPGDVVTINGLDGHDTLKIVGGFVGDIHGGEGNDTITGGSAADMIFGGDGNDLINGGAGNDTIFGEGGNDRISGDTGNDILDGGSGTNRVTQ